MEGTQPNRGRMARPGRGRGSRAVGGPQLIAGGFSNGPMDPPPAFKSGWKDIRLEIGLGSTSVTLNTWTIKDSLTALGIAANAVKLKKIAVWVNPGAAANQARPEVILSVRDPFGKGTLGTRTDTGQLSRAAHLHYSFSSAVRDLSIDLPSVAPGIELAAIQASAALGVAQISLSYNI